MPTTQAQELEQALCCRRAPGLFPAECASEFVLPDYQRSLVNVPATLGALLETNLPGVAEPLPAPYWHVLASGVRRIVLVLLDGLGYRHLQTMLSQEPEDLWGRLAGHGVLLPMTSACPSTTAVALSTLFTGVAPLAHGLLGYELWLREYGVLTDMLGLKPVYGPGRETLLDWGLVPENLLPVPGLGTLLGTAGIATRAFVRHVFWQGTLTRMLYRGFQRIHGHTTAEGLWALARYWLQRELSERSLYLLYWGGIDHTAHLHGATDGAWQAEYSAVSRACEEHFLSCLTREQRRGTLLVMLADHGFVDAPRELAHDTEANAALQRQLAVPYSGEARLAFLHSLTGADPDAQRSLQYSLGPDYLVCRMAEAVQAGLFGDPAQVGPEALARLGHFLVVARGHHYLDRRNLREKLRGRHGGLTADEMLVPWLAVRLDD